MGAGFLGAHLAAKLEVRGCSEIFVPRGRHYDLVSAEGLARAYDESNPGLVIHLAAVVGGIGANMAQPGRFFYDNPMMGVQLMEQAPGGVWPTSWPWAPSAPTPSSPRRRLNMDRAKAEFGFTAQVGFEEGLKNPIEWCRQSRLV